MPPENNLPSIAPHTPLPWAKLPFKGECLMHPDDYHYLMAVVNTIKPVFDGLGRLRTWAVLRDVQDIDNAIAKTNQILHNQIAHNNQIVQNLRDQLHKADEHVTALTDKVHAQELELETYGNEVLALKGEREQERAEVQRLRACVEDAERRLGIIKDVVAVT